MDVWVALIAAVASAAIGSVTAILVQRRQDQGQRDLKLLDLKFAEIHQFLKTDGLMELIGFFKDETPAEVLRHLSNISTIDRHFQEQRERLDRINRLLPATMFNPVTGRIHDHIESNEKFISRLEKHKESKQYLREHITKLEIVQDILRTADSIFIESGSTLAYCMLPMIDHITELRPSCETKPLRVCTNNVAIYMILLFEKYFDPVLLPGKPDNQYGATFAGISGAGQDQGEGIRKFLLDNEVTALFTTASFLDVLYGPHVSSERNHAIKRVLNGYANEHAYRNLLVITAEKVTKDGKNIGPDCKLIFDHRCTPNVDTNADILDETRIEWENQLRRANNYVITGSHRKDVCQAARDDFCEVHHFMRSFSLEFDNGAIVKLNADM